MEKEKDPVFILCDVVRQTAYELHQYLGHGHLEKVYENGMLHRLRKAGLQVDAQKPLQVRDQDGTVLGDYFADLFINNMLIVELKACRNLHDDHIAQLLGYLRCSSQEHGLLINFGTRKLQINKYANLNDYAG